MYISEITENGKITATKDNGYTVSYSLEKELFESIKKQCNYVNTLYISNTYFLYK